MHLTCEQLYISSFISIEIEFYVQYFKDLHIVTYHCMGIMY